MWFPADERRLLAGYYRNIGDVEVEKAFEVAELSKLLGWWAGYGRRTISKYGESAESTSTATSPQDQRKEIKKYIADDKRIRRANRQLALHGLITENPHQLLNSVVVVALTLNGYDLGRKYASCFARSGLWFDEYRNHWLWFILACVGGGIIGAAIQQGFKLLFPDGK